MWPTSMCLACICSGSWRLAAGDVAGAMGAAAATAASGAATRGRAPHSTGGWGPRRNLAAQRATSLPANVAVARQLLLGYDVGGLVGGAAQWVKDSASSVASKVAMSVGQVTGIFSNASSWVNKGVQVASAAVQSMYALAHKMSDIFRDFSPLKPIFADSGGLLTLFSSGAHVRNLVHVVRDLLNTSSLLQTLSGALKQVSDMFVELSSFFTQVLSKLGMSGTARRLSGSWTSLLDGIDFKAIAKQMQEFISPLADCTSSLMNAQDVLGPLLEQLDKGLAGRSLLDAQNLTSSLQANQQKYAGAISKIVPSWQAVENLGVKMCPSVEQSQSSASSLQCRIMHFVQGSTGLSLGALSGIVGECPLAKASASSQCPTSAFSAGIKDVLGEHASELGWILAVAASLGLLGGGGGIFTFLRSQGLLGGGGGSDDESTGQSLVHNAAE